jgi:antitoxin HicB
MMYYKVPLRFESQPGGGYIVTSLLLPELVTEGNSLDEAYSNARDALAAVVELYEDFGRTMPEGVCITSSDRAISFEALVTTA